MRRLFSSQRKGLIRVAIDTKGAKMVEPSATTPIFVSNARTFDDLPA
jgi:hypothetical protein